jgi:RHS repeat-associated protein
VCATKSENKYQTTELTYTDANFSGLESMLSYSSYSWDVTLELYYAQARMYTAADKRFTTQDPAKDGTNWYAYCADNPLINIDVYGLKVMIGSSIIDSANIHGEEYASIIDIISAYGGELGSLQMTADGKTQYYRIQLYNSAGGEVFLRYYTMVNGQPARLISLESREQRKAAGVSAAYADMFDVDYFHKLVCDYGISVELLYEHDDSNEYGISIDLFVAIAELELGYLEKAKWDNLDNPGESSANDNYTKYARDLGIANGQPWCATFVSWVAKKAGIPSTVINATAGARNMERQYKNRGNYVPKSKAGAGQYIPHKGDIAFWWRDPDGVGYDNGKSGHVGIVVASTAKRFWYINGNSDNRVQYNDKPYTDYQFLGFGTNGGTSDGVIPQGSTGKASTTY